MSTQHPRPSSFNLELQGLRAVAIVFVVAYHADHRLLPGGYVGVDIFFAISGFLITGLLAREIADTGKVDLARFYARRARRLLPAAILVLIATVLVARVRLAPLDLKMFGSAATTTALYVGNMWFAYISTDYLRAGEADLNPLLHYWSLCVEEQFYLVWPVLIIGLVALARWRRSGRLERNLTYGLLSVAGVSLALSVVLTDTRQAWAFFGMPPRGWEFALGGVTALIVRGRPPRSGLPAGVLGVAGMVGMLAGAILFGERTAFPGIAALLPVAGACLALAASAAPAGAAPTRFLRSSPFQLVGALSYSWYLWHWPVMIFLRPRGAGADATLWASAGAVLSLALAWITYHWIENPFRFSRRLAASHRLSIGLGLGLAGLGALFALGVRWNAAFELATPEQRRYRAAHSDQPEIYADGCHALYYDVRMPPCIYGPDASDTTVVLFGDSHAAQWFPAVQEVRERRSWRLVSLTKSHCPPLLFVPWDDVLRRSYTECAAWQEATLERIETLAPTLVVLGVSSHYDLDPSDGGDAPVEEEDWRAGVHRALERLVETGAHVVLFRDTPYLAERAPKCLSRAAWLGRDPEEACRFQVPRSPPRMEERIVLEEAGRLGVSVLDMGPALCSEASCALERGSMVLFLDENHLSASFARSLGPVVGAKVDSILASSPGR